ncbi:glutathione S-transferase family protein [Phenylobacterium sp. J426]|uniref:glutathione S-transferase family protein n=1 Tax=Phenylobacterium sp. J426 TaxID=2898439 RepID=UPI002151DCFC|nr:glutathione S-transferase family protein [Phenylobacterium sp. J426]MCR5875256.1 glutathione S-transferase family protein [Phenylobacterium sp. J426]
MSEIILHHYDTSPFSEKVRVMLGIKGLAWRSVIQPVIMPKPELVPLTGGYRRIPVMQIGADVYCDSQVILAEIEARHPDPPVVRGADWAVNLWADRQWFQATVACVFSELGDAVPKAFIEDREKLSGRPFDIAGMKAAAPSARAQWRAFAGWADDGLAGGDFLGGATPSLADVAAYMNVWWLSGSAPVVAAALMAGYERAKAWRARIAAVGHGRRSDMSAEEALLVARHGMTDAPPESEDDPSGLKPGDDVIVHADDYGRDPIAGRLVALNRSRAVIARAGGGLDQLHVHFPRAGYVVSRA